MKKFIYLFFLTSHCIMFSQNDTISYYFDKVELALVNNTLIGKKGVQLKFFNSKNYSYELIVENAIKIGYLKINNNQTIIPFTFNEDITSEKQLDKLIFDSGRIKISSQNVKSKNYVETSFIRNSDNKDLSVFIKHYKNSKKKKVLMEFEYIFTQNSNNLNDNTSSIIKTNLLNNNSNILFDEKDTLKKTIIKYENKKIIETEITNINNTSFTLCLLPQNLVYIKNE